MYDDIIMTALFVITTYLSVGVLCMIYAGEWQNEDDETCLGVVVGYPLYLYTLYKERR